MDMNLIWKYQPKRGQKDERPFGSTAKSPWLLKKMKNEMKYQDIFIFPPIYEIFLTKAPLHTPRQNSGSLSFVQKAESGLLNIV